MKSILFFVFGATVLFITSTSLHAEDWTTTDGKVYKDVKVVKTEPDAVTITDHDGGALIPLTKLSPDLQKRFNYDPVKAKAAADARTEADAKNGVALQAEIDQAQVKRRIDLITSDPRNHYVANQPTGPILAKSGPSDSPTVPETPVANTPDIVTESGPDSPTTTYNIADTSHDPLAEAPGANHHSTSDLVDIYSRLKDDHPSPNRHTASSLLLASSYLLPDPLDPSHHSTDELVKSASVLIPPASDTGNRHSMDSISQGDPLARP
jgi:hypothetical protein